MVRNGSASSSTWAVTTGFSKSPVAMLPSTSTVPPAAGRPGTRAVSRGTATNVPSTRPADRAAVTSPAPAPSAESSPSSVTSGVAGLSKASRPSASGSAQVVSTVLSRAYAVPSSPSVTRTPRMPRPASRVLPSSREAVVSIDRDGSVSETSPASLRTNVKEPVIVPVTSIPSPVDRLSSPSSARTSRPAVKVRVRVKPIVSVLASGLPAVKDQPPALSPRT